MTSRFRKYKLIALVLIVAAVAVLLSGVVPIRASDGHWPITRWFLEFASSRSISTHSRSIVAPDLSSLQMRQLGAATYDNNCRWCHGAPGLAVPQPAASLTPAPPSLQAAVLNWTDTELFYITKHGIKFAGMPAWPMPHHDDEIWPMVAFLRTLPEMSPETYQQLVGRQNTQESDEAQSAARECDHCHQRLANLVPSLSGQNSDYLQLSMQAYRHGDRASGIMQSVASRWTDAEIDAIAGYYSTQAPPAGATSSTAVSKEAKQNLLAYKLATDGDRQAKIPACNACHKSADQVMSAEYPKLEFQPAAYLEAQLRRFRNGTRGGTVNAKLMQSFAHKLSDQQIAELAAYYAGGAKIPNAETQHETEVDPD